VRCAASAPGLPSPTVRTRRRSLRGTGRRLAQCWMRCSTEVACTVNWDQPPKAKASRAATGRAIASAIKGFLVSRARTRSDWRRRRTDPPVTDPPVYGDMTWFPLSSAAASSARGLHRRPVAVGGVPRGTSCPPTAGTNLRSAPLAGRHAPGPSLRHPEGGRSSPGTTTEGGGPVPKVSGSPLTGPPRGRGNHRSGQWGRHLRIRPGGTADAVPSGPGRSRPGEIRQSHGSSVRCVSAHRPTQSVSCRLAGTAASARGTDGGTEMWR